jgi:Mg-chelatase subunit ChlD
VIGGLCRIEVVLAVGIASAGCGRGGGNGSSGSGSAAAVGGSASAGAGTGGQGIGAGGAAAASTGSAATPAAAVVPEPAPAPEDASLGANIALAVLGGHVVSPAESGDLAWRVSNLLDGYPVIRGIGAIETSLGWRSEAAEVAQAVVIGFREQREATIAAVVLDTVSDENLAGPAAIPRDIELLVSTTSATDGFTKVAAAALPAQPGETVLRFAPTKAKWVKLAIASTHDNVPPQLGEIQIYEAAGVPSVAADVAKNLLSPALGGSLVRFTSQAAGAPAAELMDGKVGDEIGWSSAAGPVGAAAHLPQDFTFAFRDHRAAFIDRLVLDPTSGGRFYSGPRPNMTTWAKTIEILTSDTSPWAGFAQVAVVAVPQAAAPIEVPIGRSVRFIKLRILENNGGESTTFGEVQAFEGTPSAGRSILAGRGIPIDRVVSPAAVGPETAARREREPNNTQKEADRVEAPTPIGGGISSETDRDVFLVPGAPTGAQTLTVDVEGRPAIRTRVTVMDTAFATRYVLDPSRTSGTRARFTVVAGPGDLFVQVLQPPAAQVVIWDTSGSMKHRVADLEAALRDYLGKVQPTDRVQLIRFDTLNEVLLKDFTGQSAQLVAALTDKVFADGGTSIYDAIGTGVALLDKVEGSRAVVMMTDGEDTTSTSEPTELWAALDRSRVRLYAIGLGDSLRNYMARAGMTGERMLADTALATGGRYMFVAESAKLGGLYAEIGAELRAPATYAITATTSTATGTLAVKAVGDRLAVPPRVELVLDASGSMKRELGGKAMMDIAKGALTDVIARLPGEAQVALRVYGHRLPDKRAGACEDSELLVPFGPLDKKQLTSTVKRVKPRGTTPIAFAIERAGEDLRDAKGPAILILVTDGKEECGGDPAAAATALRAAGLDVTLSIVGFGLTDPADRDAMTKVAGLGGGAYHDAQDEAALAAAIDRATAVPFTVVDATGAVVGRGLIGGEPIGVPVGELAIRIESATEPIVVERVPIVAGKATRVDLSKAGDEIGVNIVTPAGGP